MFALSLLSYDHKLTGFHSEYILLYLREIIKSTSNS